MAVKCFSEGTSWTWPCLCVDSISISNSSSSSMSSSSTMKANTINASYFNTNIGFGGKRRLLHFSNSFLDSCSAKMLSSCISSSTKTHKLQRLIIVDELGGQYDDTFNDVKKELVNYFTFKAVRTVLEQLYEMNPPQYKWFNKRISLIDNGDSFVADNVPNNGTRFLQTLVKERRELAERVMITRLTLYGRWIKKCDHGEIYKEISEENLKLMRERLLETIQWPSDDNTKSDQETD